jgi:GntR family transcriptional repressor for pyruvate dehydrogenase complex
VSFSPSKVRRPREQVEAQIREAILSGAFRQGEKLPSETALAEQFAVSRTTVREALRSLAAGGLIAKIPGVAGGSFVQSVDHRSLGSALGDSLENILRIGSITRAEVDQLRRIIEVPCAALAAEHRSDDQLEEIERILSAEKSTTVEDPTVPDLDVAFHTAVAEASGNRPLAAFVRALHRLERPVASLRLSPHIGREAVRQHMAVARALRDGRPGAASSAMGEHLEFVGALPRVGAS